jgi:hypothetical protein
MDEGLQSRVAGNEALFRKVNEAIERGQWPGEEDSPAAFRCECARLDCNKLISLTPREYKRVRATPRRFLVIPVTRSGNSRRSSRPEATTSWWKSARRRGG